MDQPTPLRQHLTLVGGHADEIAELMAGDDAKFDRSYHETVQRNFFEQAAGKRLRRMVEALAHQGDFTPNAALRSLLKDYDHEARGFSLRNASSSTCDCNFAELRMYRGRCVSCGCSLAEDMRRWRKEVDDADTSPA